MITIRYEDATGLTKRKYFDVRRVLPEYNIEKITDESENFVVNGTKPNNRKGIATVPKHITRESLSLSRKQTYAQRSVSSYVKDFENDGDWERYSAYVSESLARKVVREFISKTEVEQRYQIKIIETPWFESKGNLEYWKEVVLYYNPILL